MTRAFLPASIGVSVLLPASTTSIIATARWADYTALEVAPREEEQPLDEGAKRKRTPRDRLHWQRVAKMPVVVAVPLDEKKLAAGIEVTGSGGLQLVGKLAPTSAPGLKDGTRSLALFLVNRRQVENKQVADLAYAFQHTSPAPPHVVTFEQPTDLAPRARAPRHEALPVVDDLHVAPYGRGAQDGQAAASGADRCPRSVALAAALDAVHACDRRKVSTSLRATSGGPRQAHRENCVRHAPGTPPRFSSAAPEATVLVPGPDRRAAAG